MKAPSGGGTHTNRAWQLRELKSSVDLGAAHAHVLHVFLVHHTTVAVVAGFMSGECASAQHAHNCIADDRKHRDACKRAAGRVDGR